MGSLDLEMEKTLEKSTADTQAVWQVLPEPANSLPLFPANLLNDLETLSQQMVDEVLQVDWLDAYLLAAGMDQVVQDYLHPDILMLHKAAGYLSAIRKPMGTYLAAVAHATGNALSLFHEQGKQTRSIQTWQARLQRFLENLAVAVLFPERIGDTQVTGLRQEAWYLNTQVQSFPARLQNEVLRLPSCFRSFDQQPADMQTIARRFADRWPDRSQPLLVVGVRTSGDYLAPLYTVLLRNLGFQDVSTITIRPGRRLLSPERAILKNTVQRSGLVLLCDDPPSKGKALGTVARSIEQAGIAREHVILLLQLFGSSTSLPQPLRSYPAVLLPWSEWSVQGSLNPEAARAAFNQLLGNGWSVLEAKELTLSKKSWERSHARALFEMHLVKQNEARPSHRLVFVEGAGLGYFGEHALVAAQALEGSIPHVYGRKDGLLFQEGFPEKQGLPRAGIHKGTLAQQVASYVDLRRRKLPSLRDYSQNMFGQNAVWEVASNLLARVYGRAWLLVRLPLVDPVVKCILYPTFPTVIDGNMGLSNWFYARPKGSRLVKTGFARRAFSNLDLACYDPVYDLAQVTATYGDPSFEEELRHWYEIQSGERIGPERWLIYQLIDLWQHDRCDPGIHADIARMDSLALQRYFGEVLFRDLEVPSKGPLVALDLDGVLETHPLGFPGTTPTGAEALYALNQHGYRAVIASGRSLREVRERCASYRLAGGVAEYGAAIFNQATGTETVLLDSAEIEVLSRLHTLLENLGDILIDPDFVYSVRAYCLDSHGQRAGLSSAQIAKVLDWFPGRLIRAVPGQQQTDFTIARVDKATGLCALASELGMPDAGDEPLLAMAVGDSAADLPMLQLAALAYAPANAQPALRQAGVKLLPHAYQAGLADAVRRLIGHRPGACSSCKSAPLARETELFFSILSAQEDGLRSMLPQAIRLWMKLRGKPHG